MRDNKLRNLRDYLEYIKMSKNDLAEKLGISKQYSGWLVNRGEGLLSKDGEFILRIDNRDLVIINNEVFKKDKLLNDGLLNNIPLDKELMYYK